MYKASAGVTLPTSIIGSLPRPSWYTENMGGRSFLEAMVSSRYREQYEDAVSCFLRAQEIAGLDILTDGDAHYDEEVGGMSWQGYPLTHMDGFAEVPQPMTYKIGAAGYPRGHILHDFLEARVFPRIVGPIGRGRLQYTAMWKVAQRTTTTRTRSSAPGRSAMLSTPSSPSSPRRAARCCRWRSRRSTWCRRAARP